MDKFSKNHLDIVEKLTNWTYFLFFMSLVVFTDTYLLARHNTPLRQLSDTWFQSHNILLECLVYFVCLGFFYAMFVPLSQYLIGYCNIWGKSPSTNYGWVNVDTLKEFAIRTKNAQAYQEYEKKLTQVSEIQRLESISLSLLILFLANYIWSDKQNVDLLQFAFLAMDTYPWYIRLPLCLLSTLFMLFVTSAAFRQHREYDDYIYLSSFHSWETDAPPSPTLSSNLAKFLEEKI